jgi:hypothetical protein
MESSDKQSIVSENNAGHEALVRLAARLTDEELARPMESGWTIAALLAHLAFWDARAVLLIEKWQREGIGPSPADTDIVNDAARALCLAIPARAAADLAVKNSAEVNRSIETLSPEMIERIQEIGSAVHLIRYEHKRVHMEEIEQAVGTG